MGRLVRFLIFLAVFPVFSACGPSESDRPAAVPPAAGPLPAAGPAPAAAPTAPRIVFLGDSLTAGLGLDVADSFPARIQDRLRAEGLHYEVVNAGVSGDTSAGGLRRLEWALMEGDPKLLIVALGGNDGLRGLSPEQLEQNLAAIIDKARSRGVRVILAGMEAPPNFGAEYTARFRAVYPTLAERYDIPLIPFLLDGVAGDPALNQSDGIHPNARGADKVAELVWPAIAAEIDSLGRTSTR